MSKVVSLSEAGFIALHSLILIARSEKPLNVLEISEITGSSKHHVAKVLQRLAKENFLLSQRGPTGGFSLKKKPSEITFLQIYEAIEGKIEIANCPFNRQICPFDKCILNNVTNRMTIEFVNYMKMQSLDQYIGSNP